MPDQLEKVLSRSFDRQQEKLDQIEPLNLPDGPARDNLLEGSLGVRSQMDKNYFKEVQNVSTQFNLLQERLQKATTFEDHVEVVTQFGQDSHQALMKTGTEGIVQAEQAVLFMKQAFSIYVATAPKGDLQALSKWVESKHGIDMQDYMADLMQPQKGRDELLQQVGSIALKAMNIASVLLKEVGLKSV